MKVMLLYDVDRVGKQGEVVSVRPGFARNFLLPKRLATVPHPGAEKQLELIRRRQNKEEQKLISGAEEVAKALEGVSAVTIEHRANAEGALFGSVSPSMITQALTEHKIRVDARQVEIKEPIKQVGEFTVSIRLYKEIARPLKVVVKATEEVKASREPAGSTPQTPSASG